MQTGKNSVQQNPDISELFGAAVLFSGAILTEVDTGTPVSSWQ